jgi:hypothetical protein
MSEWKVTGGYHDSASRVVFTVTKGTRRLDHREQDELEALLAGWRGAIRDLITTNLETVSESDTKRLGRCGHALPADLQRASRLRTGCRLTKKPAYLVR